MLGDSYAELRRYDGAAIQRDQRDRVVECAVQARDLAVIRDVWRYKFLTSPQIHELHWPQASPRVANKRLAKLFEAGLVERFRPFSRTSGSFPWTYQLGPGGHHLLRDVGEIHGRCRYEFRDVYDYRYVLHEIHRNAWVLAWRRHARDRILDWLPETEIVPPGALRRPERLDDERLIKGIRDSRPRLVRPDAIVETARSTGGARVFLIEYDRTRRVDKNFEKFLRYDALLCWWWRYTWLAQYRDPPYVVFICQDDGQRDTFLQVAARELTGNLWHAVAGHEHVGRDQILFVTEAAVHAGETVALRVPRDPEHSSDNARPRQVALPSAARSSAAVSNPSWTIAGSPIRS